MPLYVTHISALRFWRFARLAAQESPRLNPGLPQRQARRAEHNDLPRDDELATGLGAAHALCTQPTWGASSEARMLLQGVGLSFLLDDLHLASPCDGQRIRGRGITSHVLPRAVQTSWFRKVAPGVCVAAPSLAFFQMAAEYPVPKLAYLGLELCGTFSLGWQASEGRSSCDAAATAQGIRRLAAQLEGVMGAKTAREALRYVADGCASPMEAKLLLLLCLPVRSGGYGLPLPQVNARIDFAGLSRTVATVRYRKCDLFWPQAKLAVEYDGQRDHTGITQVAADSSRRNELLFQEVRTISVTKRQVYDRVQMDKTAAIIAKCLGKRQRHARDWSDKRIALRRELLDTWE